MRAGLRRAAGAVSSKQGRAAKAATPSSTQAAVRPRSLLAGRHNMFDIRLRASFAKTFRDLPYVI